MKSIIEIKNLEKSYYDKLSEIKAVENFSLDVYDKEFLVIVGPSGCGKSTILSILANLEKPTNGNIKLNKDIKIGYMLQEDSLFPWLTILDNCYLGLKIKKIFNEKYKKYVKELLNTYGLKEFENKYPSSLSGGMKQRVALIRTIATKPNILLLDEPFSKLDYQTRLILSNDIYNIVKKEKITVIMVNHDLEESISLADRIVVLTNRPCKIKNIYNIDLTNKTDPINNRKCKEFSIYYDKIWRDIDAHL